MHTVGVLGAGSMGSGIAQVAATAGHKVVLTDTNEQALEKARQKLAKVMARLEEKGRVNAEESRQIQSRISYSTEMSDFSEAEIVIEAIIEDLAIKKKVFKNLEGIVNDSCILATNTSSLSVASIAAACERANRVIGIHFFNPAPLMPLVEIIPAIQTDNDILQQSVALINSWGKVTAIAKDTPGFIVNRIARPFYGEALRIYEEGIASFETIDWAMKELGGFRMGPFELMDFIGNDINFAVTESVFEAFFYDPRYRPSFTQKRYSEAGWYGRKSGRGYYDYSENGKQIEAVKDIEIGNLIVNRIVVMLINEAVDALYLNIASKESIDLAMTKGVNYPKGLLKWADEIGVENCLAHLQDLQEEYGEDRYRPSPMLKKMVRQNESFYKEASITT